MVKKIESIADNEIEIMPLLSSKAFSDPIDYKSKSITKIDKPLDRKSNFHSKCI